MLLLVIFTSTMMVPNMSEFTCQGVGFYPHPASSSQFYRCTDLWETGDYQQYLFQCPAGTAWDSEVGVCNWPGQVAGCGEGGSPPPPSSPATTPPTTPSSTPTTPSSTSTTQSTTTTPTTPSSTTDATTQDATVVTEGSAP